MNVNDSIERRSTAGFTLVEIAISIAVVAFALVAIIGILPTGMNVQKQNSHETVINNDAPLLLEAIRTGSTNIHNLAGNLEWLQIWSEDQPLGPRWFPFDGATASDSLFGLIPPNAQYPTTDPRYNHSGARDIIGHLSTPAYEWRFWSPVPMGSRFPVNTYQIKARFLANSGNTLALEANSAAARNLSFSYLVTSEVFPFRTIGQESQILSNNLHEVRLTFQWPVLGPSSATGVPRVGKGRKVFRTTVAGQLLLDADGSNYFFHSSQYGRRPQ